MMWIPGGVHLEFTQIPHALHLEFRYSPSKSYLESNLECFKKKSTEKSIYFKINKFIVLDLLMTLKWIQIYI